MELSTFKVADEYDNTYMDQFLQGGKNGRLMSFFF